MVITSFYKFMPLNDLPRLRDCLFKIVSGCDGKGLILLGCEGVNGTVCTPAAHASTLQRHLDQHFGALDFKTAEGIPEAFHKLKIKIKPEIVTMGTPELRPAEQKAHLSPAAWHQRLDRDEVQVLDVRNDYEVRVGQFDRAVHLDLQDFSQFPDKLRQSRLDPRRETLIYCTGGIRCEKAALEMQRQGFENVQQLGGGILKYLAEHGPQGAYVGECFVFDYRVAVDHDLRPTTRYRLCPHCGEPGQSFIQCRMCGQEKIICQKCLDLETHRSTCSKNCAHHSRRGHRSTRPPRIQVAGRPR